MGATMDGKRQTNKSKSNVKKNCQKIMHAVIFCFLLKDIVFLNSRVVWRAFFGGHESLVLGFVCHRPRTPRSLDSTQLLDLDRPPVFKSRKKKKSEKKKSEKSKKKFKEISFFWFSALIFYWNNAVSKSGFDN